VSIPAVSVTAVSQEVIPILRVASVDRSVAWYAQLGFHKEWEHRLEADQPAFASIARGRGHIYLSEHDDDASPDTLVYIRHSQLDDLARRLGQELTEVPWGRELKVEDPDGNRLRISDPIDD
jgi:catechol 2,3-dioxygenase-like lactoylglutathione lyase family enzyme